MPPNTAGGCLLGGRVVSVATLPVMVSRLGSRGFFTRGPLSIRSRSRGAGLGVQAAKGLASPLMEIAAPAAVRSRSFSPPAGLRTPRNAPRLGLFKCPSSCRGLGQTYHVRVMHEEVVIDRNKHPPRNHQDTGVLQLPTFAWVIG